MERRIVRPAELDLESRGRRDYWVALEHDSIWGDHLIPLTVFVGPAVEPGKGLVAFGSTHGNEYEGPVAIRHLLDDVRIEQVTGRIVLVPVLNVAAFRAGARNSTLDDGVNLNRAFVAEAGRRPGLAGITHRIADFVRRSIWPHVHVVIDLHSGGQVARFERCASFHPIEDPQQNLLIEETARWFGTPLLVIYQNETPGLLTSEAERHGKITVGSELGWGASVSAEGVRYARHGVRAAAIHHGQMRGSVDKIAHHAAGTQRKVAMVDRACFVCAPFDGHYEPVVECGAELETGDLVGWLHDFDRIDLPPAPIRAATDGVLIAQAWQAPVRKGQHIVVVGHHVR